MRIYNKAKQNHNHLLLVNIMYSNVSLHYLNTSNLF